jgi:digeranylgeranylglycerophospholipid reductase
MEWDVIVIGAGPSGCFTALQIALSGFKVLVIEEHMEIGLPVQCAGLISPRAMELAGMDKSIVVNEFTGLRVSSPLGASLYLESNREVPLAVDRTAFDQQLAAKAENAGAILVKGLKVDGIERISDGFRLSATDNNKTVTMNTKLLIGADGAHSKTARWLELNYDNPNAVMYSVDAELKSSDTNLISVFLGQNIAPGWFGWIIPLDSKTCRIGTGYALVQPKYSAQHYFQEMVNLYEQCFQDLKIIRCTGGTVPLGLMPKIYTRHAMLVGDAAGQTKPISGGGIYMGLKGAQICGQVVVEALNEGDLSETKLSRYQKLWEMEMGDEITCAMLHRECFMDFTDEDIEFIIRFLSKPLCKKIILKYGDIDYPSHLAKKFFGLGPWRNGFFKVALRITGFAHLL